ncbi:MAG: transcription-repair coupling factor, partial [Pyrinomonadaceae bacterium]|nr:transcription-repair coupling factor [Pyrinomonadaceae bacterium]
MNPSTQHSDQLKELRDKISSGRSVLNLSGLTSIAAKAYVLSELQKDSDRTFVIVANSNKELETWENDLEFFQKSAADPESEVESLESRLLTLPSFEADVYSGVSPHAETQEVRALALWRLLDNAPDFLITSAKSLITKTISPKNLKDLGAILKRDSDFSPEELIEKLLASGYRQEEPIANVGEFSMRGGIVDIWSPDSETPVRIEFFGDTVDSIRSFDANTQLSIEQLKETSVAPMREFAADSDDFKIWAETAKENFSDESFARNLKDRTEFADEGEDFSGWEFLFSLVRPMESDVFEYLKNAIFIFDEPAIIEQALAEHYQKTLDHYEEIIEHGEIGLAPETLFLDSTQLRSKLEIIQRLELRSLGKLAAETDEELALEGKIGRSKISDLNFRNEDQRPKKGGHKPIFLFSTAENSADFEIQSRSVRKYQGDIKKFAKLFPATAQSSQSREQGELRMTNDELLKALFVFQSNGLAERFNDILRDYDVILPQDLLKTGDLSGGFEIPSLNTKIYTETEVFGEQTHSEFEPQKPKTRSRKPKTSAFISDFRDLKQGDYVVHVDHGIGRFDGLQTIETSGVEREFVLLHYAEKSKLFVPVERLDLVSRYSSGEGVQPNLDKLGGIGWQKTKAKAKRAMRDMADELLRLYAERELVQGFAFSKDAPWQKEFEDAFPYKLTEDQTTSVEDIKKDMETPTPMDRLIIGDVGYGKTEVAMRAAFKAVMDGKQVAILTPTTVLSYQHFETFKKRFAAFPVKIEMISRFRSRKEQKEIVELTEKGEVDILIGTHRILSTDVKFSKLGLVVVDEEQRFGVAHKEKLKQLKKKVDVLTLSATPIPRTLNMSMMGMRDMSVIETPPRDRLAIHTQVVQFSEGVIKSAIELELSRNGQIFFIHNRVQTIDAIAAHVQRIVPNARIVIGHGQMSEKELERVMLEFVDYKYDVLVATTIIENGIDIPRANTIIINRADNYGLSQLYQLRG